MNRTVYPKIHISSTGDAGVSLASLRVEEVGSDSEVSEMRVKCELKVSIGVGVDVMCGCYGTV
jgi:hypothetical protein